MKTASPDPAEFLMSAATATEETPLMVLSDEQVFDLAKGIVRSSPYMEMFCGRGNPTKDDKDMMRMILCVGKARMEVHYWGVAEEVATTPEVAASFSALRSLAPKELAIAEFHYLFHAYVRSPDKKAEEAIKGGIIQVARDWLNDK